MAGDIAEPVSNLVLEINLQLQKLNDELEEGHLELKAKYDKMYSDAESASKQAEKDAISNFQSNSTMTNKELSDQLIDIRKALDSLKDDILDEKEDALKDLQKQFDDDILSIRIEHVESGDFNIIWNDSLGQYEAVALN